MSNTVPEKFLINNTLLPSPSNSTGCRLAFDSCQA
ncbi:hypothetical protein YPPY64_4421, partial [Yersinia pestis PY-64]